MNRDLTQEQATAIFHKYDDTDNLSQIKGNDQSDKFYEFLEKLKEYIHKDFEFETGDMIQDAHFHSLIFVDDKRHELIFSSYGNLISIGNEEGVDTITLERLKALAKVSGYTYIPGILAGQLYTGTLTNTSTWWDRYFSW